MDWLELQQYFENTYNFLTKIKVSKFPNKQGFPVHPLIKLSAGLALKTIASPDQNKLVILFPNRLNTARWISVLCTLEIMRNDYQNNPPIPKFHKREKLKINNCIVEFDEEEFNSEDNCWYMWVKCKTGRKAIFLDRKLIFEPTNTKRPLTPLNKLLITYEQTRLVEYPADRILGIKTSGNRVFFSENIILISKIGETEVFVKENHIDDTRIVDLCLLGKLDSEGNISYLEQTQIEAKPSFLVSSDLFGASNYISDNPNKTKGIIIDGSVCFLNYLQHLDEILKRNIPVIVVADLFDIEPTKSFDLLKERGFKIWQWNKKNIADSHCIVSETTVNPFFPINHSIANYYNQQIIQDICDYSALDEVMRKTY